jgi:hypothetical protein
MTNDHDWTKPPAFAADKVNVGRKRKAPEEPQAEKPGVKRHNALVTDEEFDGLAKIGRMGKGRHARDNFSRGVRIAYRIAEYAIRNDLLKDFPEDGAD